MYRSPFPFLFLLTVAVGAQTLIPPRSPSSGPPRGAELASRAAASGGFGRVLHGDPGTGELWAVGTDWKASFAADGFTFIPFFGAEAPRNFPVHFRVTAVQVAGRDVPFHRDGKATRSGDRITFDRGPLREIYDLDARHVEQTFVLDSACGIGDVEIELEVTSELAEDASQPGLQFGNPLGHVEYGQAFLVRGQAHTAIASTWNGRAIRLRVPAAQRDAGPVVVDPIIRTRPTTVVGTRPTSNPDIAYDHTNQVYLLVWESIQAQTDIDVFCEMFDGEGAQLPGTGAALDASLTSYQGPRVASNNSVDRFLVVMQRGFVGQTSGPTQIVGVTRDAGGARAISAQFSISNPAFGGDNTSPDVGGDSGASTGGLGWPVVWIHGGDVWLEVVRETGAPRRLARPIDSNPAGRLSTPRISAGNGRGTVPSPSWLIVYSATNAAGLNGDVRGMVLATDGTLGTGIPFDTDASHDLFPNPSSPATNSTGTQTWFLLTYERQAPAAARAILFNFTTGRIDATDLTQAFGFGPSLVRPESDGIRFAVTASMGSSGVGVATMAFNGGGLVLHEAMQPLVGFPNRPEITSAYSGGGGPTRYAVAYLDYALRPARPTVASYLGVAFGTVDLINTGCNSVWITTDGDAALGERLRFSLANFGQNQPGFALGFPAAIPTRLCATCALGLRLDQPLVTAFGSSTFDLSMPRDVRLVGVTFAVQGLTVGQGPCFNGLSLSDTLNITIH